MGAKTMNDESSQPTQTSDDPAGNSPLETPRYRVLFARPLIGWIVIICPEVLSGASLKPGLWSA